MDCSMPGFPVLRYLLEFAQIHVHWASDAIQPCYPLLLPSPPALNLSQHQGLFQWAALHIRWPKYWSFSFSISPSNEYSGLISFRMDWLDLLAVQGTLKSLLQHHNLKLSVVGTEPSSWSNFTFIYDYWKGHIFDWTTFVSKVMSLLFNMQSWFVITFLLKSKHLLISWLQSL